MIQVVSLVSSKGLQDDLQVQQNIFHIHQLIELNFVHIVPMMLDQ